MRAFVAGVLLLVLGLVGGAVYDDAPAHPHVLRAGRRVVAADFHVHTSLSDGGLSPFVVPRRAWRQGLDVVAVTEHNGVLAAELARFAARFSGAPGADAPLVMIGEEITTFRHHLIAVGLTSTVAPTGNPSDAARDVHAQGGVLVAAHPVARFWPSLVPVRDGDPGALDGSELAHPFALASAAGEAAARLGWRASDLREFYTESPVPLTAIGSSDYHWGSGLGRVRTWVFVDDGPLTSKAVLDAIRARRTVVATADGTLAGSPALVRALEAEPLPPSMIAPRDPYPARGTADAVLRALGLLGVLALFVLRIPRRAARSGLQVREGLPQDPGVLLP